MSKIVGIIAAVVICGVVFFMKMKKNETATQTPEQTAEQAAQPMQAEAVATTEAATQAQPTTTEQVQNNASPVAEAK